MGGGGGEPPCKGPSSMLCCWGSGPSADCWGNERKGWVADIFFSHGVSLIFVYYPRLRFPLAVRPQRSPRQEIRRRFCHILHNIIALARGYTGSFMDIRAPRALACPKVHKIETLASACSRSPVRAPGFYAAFPSSESGLGGGRGNIINPQIRLTSLNFHGRSRQ